MLVAEPVRAMQEVHLFLQRMHEKVKKMQAAEI
jgi:hypothetical protein